MTCVYVGGRQWPSKAKLERHLESCLAAGEAPQALLTDCLRKLHPFGPELLLWAGPVVVRGAPGPRYFAITSQVFGERGITRARLLGRENPYARASSAARQAVAEDIEVVRTHWLRGAPRCAITDVPLVASSMDVDHVPPGTFAVLFDRYFGRQLPATRLTHSGSDAPVIADYTVARGWRDYHRIHAYLRPLHRDVNRRGAGAAQSREANYRIGGDGVRFGNLR